MKMKILYVVPPSSHFAGVERVVHDIASGLATRYGDRLDVTVLYCHRYAELSWDLPYTVIWKSVRRLRTLPFAVQSVLREQPYDIVVIAQFEPAALVWLWHRLCAGKARFVMHLHGNPKKERNSSRRARFAFSFFNALLPAMHRIVAVSPGLARYVEEHAGPRVRVEYLPNPVRQFSGATRPVRSGGPVVFVTIGRLSWEKGHDVLVEAFAKVISSGLDARLTIVGDGAARPELVAQIQRLGLGDRVRLTGKIPNPVLELEQADCFVSASRWEGFGVSIVEALSAGLYVIASDCEFGPRDLIDGPEKGRIVMTENPEALAAAMSEFVRSGRTNDRSAERREAAARFSLDHVITKHAAMLESVGRQPR